MNIKIVTDSSADLRELCGADFASAPLKIMTDEKEYNDNLDLDVHQMLDDLKKYKGRSRSSCPNTEEWITAFGDAENIFCITITSGLSGSYNSACVAAKIYMDDHPERRVYVIDSLSVGPESAIIAEKLCELTAIGYDFDTVIEKIKEFHNNTRLIFALESMHNLANNGRVSPIAAKMAGILGIRAVGRASDVGTLEMTGKSRGMYNTVSDIVKNMVSEGCAGGRIRIHHADNEAAANLLKEKLTEQFSEASITVQLARGLCCYYAEAGGLLVGFTV